MAAPPSPATRLLQRGDVVIVPFPFSDMTASKRRPAVIVSIDAVEADCTLAFITSQKITSVEAHEVAILPSHREFTATGLLAASKIRAAKLATIARSLVLRRLGYLGSELANSLDLALATSLSLDLATYREQGRREERERLVTLHKSAGIESLLDDLGLQPK